MDRKSLGSTVLSASRSHTLKSRPSVQAEAFSGIGTQQIHRPLQGKNAGLDQIGVDNGEGSLNAHHAEGALFQTPGLFLGAVGGVVGGDHVDGAVQQTLNHGLPGLLCFSAGDSS